MLALCKPPQEYAYITMRDLPRLRSDSSASSLEQECEDDDDDFPRLRRRRFDGFAPSNHRSFFRTSGPRTLRLAGER